MLDVLVMFGTGVLVGFIISDLGWLRKLGILSLWTVRLKLWRLSLIKIFGKK